MSRHSAAIDARRLGLFFGVLNGSIGSLVGPNDTISKGLQNDQIASAPEISYDGVSYPLNQIRERLGVGARRLLFFFRLAQRAVGPGSANWHQVFPIGTSHAMGIQSLIAPGLKLKEMGVLSVHREQAFVGPLFDDFAIVDDNDLIGGAHGRETMRDQNRHLVMAL